jgi:hypothetical protein
VSSNANILDQYHPIMTRYILKMEEHDFIILCKGFLKKDSDRKIQK